VLVKSNIWKIKTLQITGLMTKEMSNLHSEKSEMKHSIYFRDVSSILMNLKFCARLTTQKNYALKKLYLNYTIITYILLYNYNQTSTLIFLRFLFTCSTVKKFVSI